MMLCSHPTAFMTSGTIDARASTDRTGPQEHMRRARPRVLWALSQLQGEGEESEEE